MKITKTFHARTRDAWHKWLDKNHALEKEVWLVFYKQDPRPPGVSYDAAVEEALCYGWIDSVIQKIDEEKYVRKFTPRKPTSKWSAANKARVEKMLQEGKMTEAGRATLNYAGTADDYGRTPERRAQEAIPPAFFEKVLKKNKKAWENFCALAPSYRRHYVLWVGDARTDVTRNKRIAEAIALLEKNEKLGMR